MAAGQERDEQPIDERPLAYDDAADLGVEWPEPFAGGFDDQGACGEVGHASIQNVNHRVTEGTEGENAFLLCASLTLWLDTLH